MGERVLQIAVCEDSQAERAHIEAMLKAYRQEHANLQMEYTLFGSAEKLLEAVEANGGFGLYMLDILLPDMDGMTLAKTLRGAGHSGVMVFMTNSPDYALEAFGVRAIDYLLKPVAEKALFAALNETLAYLDSREDTAYTLVHMAEADRMVRLSNIIAVEVQGHTLCYYLASGEVLKSKVLRVSFANATGDLIADDRFIRPHQSFLVNAAHVVSISQKKLAMSNGMDIPISRLRFAEVKARYMSYLNRKSEAARAQKA